MRYSLKPLHCRPWLLQGLSPKLIESHYENNYGGALRRLNAIAAQLEAADFAKLPGFTLNGLKREELIAHNSVILHELYFASIGGDGRDPGGFAEVLTRDFGSVDRWKAEFAAMGRALGGGSGWVLLTYVPREGKLVNQYASDHSQSLASGIPILALDMYEHAYHIDLVPTLPPTSIPSCAISTGRAWRRATRAPQRWSRSATWCRRSSAISRA